MSGALSAGMNVAELLGIDEVERRAVALMPEAVRTLVQGGAGSGRAVGANVAAWRRWALRPRALVDVSVCDTEASVLGQRLALPVMIAPSGMHGLLHPDAELASARAARGAGTMMVLSMAANRAPEEVGL